MKSFKEEMENQAEIQDFNPEDILNAFRLLNKPSNNLSQELQPSKNTPISIFKQAKEQQSIFSAVSVKSEKQMLPKKTCIIKKSAQKERKQSRGRYINENSLGRLSNISKSIGPYDQSQITERNMVAEDAVIRKESESVTQQQIANMQRREQINQLQAQFRANQQQFEGEWNKEIVAFKNILQNSYRKRIEYWNQLSLFGKIKTNFTEKEVLSHKLIKFLQNQDSNLRLRKSRKANTTYEEEEKLSEMVAKEKKAYVSALLGKFSKERERYGSAELGQYNSRLLQLSQTRTAELRRCQELSNMQVLCAVERASENVEQIVCMDLKRVQELIINCYSFNLTATREKRQKLFSNVQEIHTATKRLTSSSSSLFFPNKHALHIPIQGIFHNEDEILIANEKEQCFMTLHKLLERTEFLPGEHGTWLIRMLLRAGLKIVEEISQQTVKVQAIILPSNIFVNERFEFRFRNIFFNEILYKEFRPLIAEEQLFFFPPEEKPEPSSATLWSLGVLAYSLYFGCRPFQKYQPYSWSSRQHFLVINELQIPLKSPTSEKVKDFIYYCLSKKVTTTTLVELTTDGFMAATK